MNKKVLFIDDETDFLFFVKLNLDKTGRFLVYTADDPQEGIKIAKKERPDIIFLDICMPQMSGGSVAELLSEDRGTSGIPVVFLTALVKQDEIESAGGSIGARDYLAKPVLVEDIIAKIDSVLG